MRGVVVEEVREYFSANVCPEAAYGNFSDLESVAAALSSLVVVVGVMVFAGDE